MPSGDKPLPGAAPEQELWLAELRRLLEATTVQVLRQAARLWGWPLKGTAKADLVEQMAGYLGDSARMAEGVQTLPDEELAVLIWLAALGPSHSSSKQIRSALAEASGIRVSIKAIDAHLQSLANRCLIFYSEYYGNRLPDLYRQWLPRLDAPKLLVTAPERVQQPPPLTLAAITQHAQHLLSAAATEQPAATVAPKSPPKYLAGKTEAYDPRRPGLIAPETLARWGYNAADEQHLARFLLELLVNAGLLRIVPQQQGAIVAGADPPNQAWELATADERLQRLRRAYWTQPREGESRLNSWSEWDVVFAQGLGDGMQATGYYASSDQLVQQVQVLGVWLSGLIATLPLDMWYGIESFCKLIYQVQRDPLIPPSQQSRWQWVVNGELHDAQQMPFDRWMKTYGHLVVAWLTGPATWLLFVQIGHAGDRPAAFRRPRTLPAGEAQQAPPGSLRFMADGMIGLANDWRASDLRRLLRSISVEVARDTATTLLRLDAGVFRNTLQSGQDTAAVSQTFTAAGFPLPPPVLETLQTWQRRAGRYQLYEQMAVVEFGEDVSPEELRAICRLSNAEFYQPGPRCLIFPDPQVAPGLIEELRRRGYTPQVLP